MTFNKITKLGRVCLTLVLYAFYSSAVIATEEDGGFWLNTNAQGKLPVDGLSWYAEFQPRWRQEGEHLEASILRPAIYYKLNEKSSVWFGYANVRAHPNSASAVEENRLWQQYLYNFDSIAGVKLQARTRLEERRMEGGHETGYRLRQSVRALKPLASKEKIGLLIWDEFFVHLNDTDWGAQRGTDQNRLFLGVELKVHPKLKIETGYINQYVQRNSIDKMNHIFSTSFNFAF